MSILPPIKASELTDSDDEKNVQPARKTLPRKRNATETADPKAKPEIAKPKAKSETKTADPKAKPSAKLQPKPKTQTKAKAKSEPKAIAIGSDFVSHPYTCLLLGCCHNYVLRLVVVLLVSG